METKNRLQPSAEDIDISRYFQELKSRWKLFLISFVVMMCMATLYIKITLPVYKAVSAIVIKEKSKTPSQSLDDILSGDLFGEQQNIATETGVLSSKTVKLEVIDKLGLQVGYFTTSSLVERPLYLRTPFKVHYDTVSPFIFNTPFYVTLMGNEFNISFEGQVERKNDFRFSKKARFGESITTPYFSIKLVKQQEVETEDTDFKFIIYSPSKITAILDENLKIEPLNKDASILVLSYQDNIDVRAVDILNTMAESYINLDIKDKASVASLTLKFVDEQLNATTEQLAAIEQELQTFKEKNKTIDLSLESKAILDRLNSVETDRMQSQIEMQSLDNLLEYVSSNRDMSQLAPSSLGVPDPLLVQLIQSYQQLQSRRNSISYGMKSDAPALKVIDKQIADTRAALIENIKSIQNNIKAANQTLMNKIASLESSISRVPETERDLLAIKRKFDVNQNIYLYLLQKKAETSIAKATVVSDNRVLDEAMLLDEPVAPNLKLIFGLAFALSIVLPVVFIIFQKLFKSTVSSRDEVASITSVPITGVVGHLKEPDNKAVLHKPKSAIAEAFRSIRTNLQFYGNGQEKKTILITSSVGSEGKSFVSINLATVFALQGNKVVLVGLDLRKPKLFEDFGLDNRIGVSSFLIGQASLDQVIRKTEVENLDIITSGPIPPNPAELISKTEMKTFFDGLKERYDIVIIDTPPLGIVSDAFQLMNYSNINLYIVRENFSKIEFIRSLEEIRAEGKISNMSIIINDTDFSKRYGYGYGHNYGYIKGGEGYYEADSNGSIFTSKIFRKNR
jgi:capsular exopolysaccharide synthesis family protein